MTQSATFCASPWVGLQVNTNGTLMPCCEFNQANSGLGKFYTFREYDQWQTNVMLPLKQDLLNGTKSPGCNNCWAREAVDLSTGYAADSLRTSINSMFADVDIDINSTQSPKSLTVMFGNFCNLRCIQCGPVCSSSHQTEQRLNRVKFEQLDLYRVDEHTEKKWWQTSDFGEFLNKISSDVQHVFLHGGEPLITPEAVAFLEGIPNPENIELSLTTNATVLTDEVYELIKKFKQLSIVVSLEGVGVQNDYLRYGGDWHTIATNIRRFQTLNNLSYNKVVVNHTLQYTSQFSLLPLIEFCHDNNLILRIGMLGGVEHLSVNAMTDQQRQRFVDQLTESKAKHAGCPESINAAEYALNFLNTHHYDAELNKKFYKYIQMIDSIRGTNYFEVFGELDK